MRTAVQLRCGHLRCELVHGEPASVHAGALGPIALFEADRIVAYGVASSRRSNIFVFRTLPVDDRLAARVPGVHPRVRLLFHVHAARGMHVHAARGIAQVRRLFAFIAKHGHDAARLQDGFYLRVGAAVLRRQVSQAALRALLRHELEGGAPSEVTLARSIES